MFGQFGCHPSDDGAEVLFFQRATDPVAIEAPAFLADKRFQSACGLTPQILVLCALHHAEQRLIGLVGTLARQLLVLVEAPLRPLVGALYRILLILTGVDQRGELVEGEHDVGAQLMLDLHGHLRSEPVRRPVQV